MKGKTSFVRTFIVNLAVVMGPVDEDLVPALTSLAVKDYGTGPLPSLRRTVFFLMLIGFHNKSLTKSS
jgi:hypothetical protein